MGLFGLYLITWQAPKMHLVHDFLKTFQVFDDGKIIAQAMQEPIFIDQSVIWDIMRINDEGEYDVGESSKTITWSLANNFANEVTYFDKEGYHVSQMVHPYAIR